MPSRDMSLPADQHLIFKVFQLLIVLALAALLFLPGISGSFYFDDIHPLSKLTSVSDFETALNYVLGDASGVLGRQLTLLTFLLHINDWPDNGEAFFIVNIAIHLLCGAFIYCISVLLMKLLEFPTRYSYHLIGLACVFLWLILPIHSATVFIAIQRMAQLSTLFVLFGLSLYLYGLYKQKLNSNFSSQRTFSRPILMQLGGIFIGTFLAMFSKENGVLLPVFVLVIETTLLVNCAALQQYRRLRISVGLLSLLLVLFAIVVYAIRTGNDLDVAEYTLIQRAITQPYILLDYIKLSFIPSISSIHPFHDSFEVAENFLSTKVILPLLILTTAIIMAFFTRKSLPLLSFGIFWFLTAHLIESTIIPLELVFLHRNYLALVGPIIAIVLALSLLKNTRITGIGYFGYSGIMALMLVFTTTTWGNSLRAAETWFVSESNSKRASMHLAELLFKNGQHAESASVLNHYVEQCDSCLIVSIQLAQVHCFLGETEQVNQVVENAISMVPKAIRIKQLPRQMRNLAQMQFNGNCNDTNINLLYELNDQLLRTKSSDVISSNELIENMILISAYNNQVNDVINNIVSLWKMESDRQGLLAIIENIMAIVNASSLSLITSHICDEKNIADFDALTQKSACRLLTEKTRYETNE